MESNNIIGGNVQLGEAWLSKLFTSVLLDMQRIWKMFSNQINHKSINLQDSQAVAREQAPLIANRLGQMCKTPKMCFGRYDN